LIGEPPLDSGPNKDVKYNLDILMKAYWQEIGWDPETGIPTRETLKSLDLLDMIDQRQ
jgi:aldehyde:ferredoxin oxidoreductase